jgi:acylphosphatase
MTSSERRRVQVRVRGEVQGVFFRDSTQRTAAESGVTGWVANRDDGGVEAEVQGAPEAVEQMLGFLHEGPQRADVDDVQVDELDPVDDETSFEVR